MTYLYDESVAEYIYICYISDILASSMLCFSLFELEMTTSCPKTDVLVITNVLQQELKKSPARLIFKQKASNPSEAALLVTPSNLAPSFLNQLSKEGYTVGKNLHLITKFAKTNCWKNLVIGFLTVQFQNINVIICSWVKTLVLI